MTRIPPGLNPRRDATDPPNHAKGIVMTAEVTGEELPPGARLRATPEERRQRAKVAANSRWARPQARQEQAEAARNALWRRFENQVDPDGLLPEDQRRQLAVNAAKAHSARMNMSKKKQ